MDNKINNLLKILSDLQKDMEKTQDEVFELKKNISKIQDCILETKTLQSDNCDIIYRENIKM